MLANIITCIRIACAPALIFCPTFSARFYIFYIIGGVSDVLDGIAARALGQATKTGARLDTIADIAFTSVVILKLLPVISLPPWLIVWIAGIALIKCVNIVGGFVKCGHLVCEHTLLNRVCGILLFALPPCVGLFPGEVSVLMILVTCAMATTAAIQEGYYIRIGKEIR